MLEGKVIGVEQVKKLATLPSREEMLSTLAAGMQSPLAGFVGALNGMMYMVVGALEALRAQRENS
jgi:large subunit ribosomal protein L10